MVNLQVLFYSLGLFLTLSQSLSILSFAGCSSASQQKALANTLKRYVEKENIDFLANVGDVYYQQVDASYYEIIDTEGEVNWDVYWTTIGSGKFDRIPRFVQAKGSTHDYHNKRHNEVLRKLIVENTRIVLLQMDTKYVYYIYYINFHSAVCTHACK
jgi:hypothetical protein